MTTLLHIDTSARRQRSVSRALAEAFVSQWRKYYATDKLIYRDVGSFPPEFVSEEWIAAAFVRGKKRTEEQKTILQL